MTGAKSLTKERVARLDALGMVWETEKEKAVAFS